jgi:hypothetical protein
MAELIAAEYDRLASADRLEAELDQIEAGIAALAEAQR